MVDIMRCFAVILCLFSCVVSSHKGVPVVIWSNSGSQLPEVYAGHSTSSKEFKENYLDQLPQDQHNIVAFLQDRLSLEDLTQTDVYGDRSEGSSFQHLKDLVSSFTSTHLPSVSSPVDAIDKLKQMFSGKVHELEAPYNIRQLPLDPTGSNLILAHLPQTGRSDGAFKRSLSEADGIMDSVTSDLKSLKTPFTAIYTARRPSKVATENLHMGRHLLADAAASNATFFNVSGCIFLYAKEIKFVWVNPTTKKTLEFTLPNTASPDSSSNCKNNSGSLVVNYNSGLPSGLDKYSMSMQFSPKSGYWYMTSLKVTYELRNTSDPQAKTQTGTNEPLKTQNIYAPKDFSYHCTDQSPLAGTNSSVNLQFKSLQVQYGKIKGNTFGVPNDCLGFFTIPIWSGIIAGLLLVAILTYGLAMISSINTMDRFDDPKGKTISVNVAE